MSDMDKPVGGLALFIQNCDFFSCNEDEERMTETDPDDAVRSELDQMLSPDITDVLAVLPKTVRVYGFKRNIIPDFRKQRVADYALEVLLEGLDEEYGDPEEATPEVDSMKAAAREFVDKVCAEYHVFACEEVGSYLVTVAGWVRENEPDWLSPVPVRKPVSGEAEE